MSQDSEDNMAEAMVEETEKIRALEEQCQRLKAEFTRYKERIKDNEERTRKKAEGELARHLLSVVDTLDRAVNSYGDDTGKQCEVVEKILGGTKNNLSMTYNLLVDVVGITPVTPSPGERFNDELHTAVETTQNNLLMDKTIVSLVRKGYMLNGDLIRPAEVVISRAVEPVEETAKAEAEAKPERKGILSKLLSGLESRVFKRGYEELEERYRRLEERNKELNRNEGLLRVTIAELNTREEDLTNRVEEWRQRKEAEETKVQTLEQSRETLEVAYEDTKRQLSILRADLDAMEVKKDKTLIESIALKRYNEERLAEKEKLLTEIEEYERRKDALNSELMEVERRKEASHNELAKLLEELGSAKETLNTVLKESEDVESKSKEEPFINYEML
ncbi:MAG: nucleotide exchange factor GrpE [Halobacteriota archaeon]